MSHSLFQHDRWRFLRLASRFSARVIGSLLPAPAGPSCCVGHPSRKRSRTIGGVCYVIVVIVVRYTSDQLTGLLVALALVITAAVALLMAGVVARLARVPIIKVTTTRA